MHTFAPKLRKEVATALNESVVTAAPRFLGISLVASELPQQWELIKPAQSALHCMALLQQRGGWVRTAYALMTMPSGKIIVQFSEAVQHCSVAHTHPCECFIVPSATALTYVEVHVRRVDDSGPSGIEVTLVSGTLFYGTAAAAECATDAGVRVSRGLFPDGDDVYELASIRITEAGARDKQDSYVISDPKHPRLTVSFDSLKRVEATDCTEDDVVQAATLRVAELSKAQRLGVWLRELPC